MITVTVLELKILHNLKLKLILLRQLLHGIKVRPSTSKKFCIICFHWKPFKNDEKCFLFHLESSFPSQDTSVLSWLFVNVGQTTWLKRQS